MIFDLVVLAALVVSCIIAFLRGFIREVLTILGVVGGGLAALSFGPHVAPLMRDWLGVVDGEDPKKLLDLIPYTILADVLAYGAVFIIVVIILSVVSHFLSGWARAIGLGAVDRSFGVLFGIARAIVLLALLYLPFYMLVDKTQRDDLFKDSRTHIYVEMTAAKIAEMLPASVAQDIEKKAQDSGGARDKLEQLDILRRDVIQFTSSARDSVVTKPTEGNGYDNEERRDIQDLIEDNLND